MTGIAGSLMVLAISAIGVALIALGIVGAGKQGTVRALGLSAVVIGLLFLLVLAITLFMRAGIAFLGVTGALVGLLALAVWVTALVDCVQNEPDERNNRLIWVIIIVFGQIIGALLYWLWWRPQRQAKAKV